MLMCPVYAALLNSGMKSAPEGFGETRHELRKVKECFEYWSWVRGCMRRTRRLEKYECKIRNGSFF